VLANLLPEVFALIVPPGKTHVGDLLYQRPARDRTANEPEL
jgi:hypothetical protein